MILLCDLSRGRNLLNLKRWDKRGSIDPDRHVGWFQGSWQKTKPRLGADRPQDELSGEQTYQLHINTAIVLARSPDKSAHWKTIFFI